MDLSLSRSFLIKLLNFFFVNLDRLKNAWPKKNPGFFDKWNCTVDENGSTVLLK